MDRIKKLKIKKQDGTFSDYIPIGADAENIDTTDGESVQLKLNKKPYYYNSVADMKADNKLKIGDMAVTLGYYEPNDGGAGEYLVRAKINEDTENGLIHIINENVVAELLIENNTINIKQLGAKALNTNLDKTDIAPYIEKYLNILNEKEYRIKLYIPSGIYHCSEIEIAIDKGFDIFGDPSFISDEANGTIITSYNNNQNHIFKIGNNTFQTYNWSLENIIFSTSEFTYSLSTGFKFNRDNIKNIDTVLKMIYAQEGITNNLFFMWINGKALSLTSCWEDYFGLLNFRHISNFNDSILSFERVDTSLNPDANLTALNFEKIMFEATHGTLIKCKPYCGLCNSHIGTLNFEAATLQKSGVEYTALTREQAQALNDNDLFHLGIIECGNITLDIDNIELNNMPRFLFEYNDTQYIYDTIIKCVSQLDDLTRPNIGIKCISIDYATKDLRIITVENGTEIRQLTCFKVDTILNATNIKTYFNVHGFPANIFCNQILRSYNDRITRLGNEFTAFIDVVNQYGGDQYGCLFYDSEAKNNMQLCVKPYPLNFTQPVCRFVLGSEKILIRAKVPVDEVVQITMESERPNHYKTFDITGTGNFSDYIIDLSSSLVLGDLMSLRLSGNTTSKNILLDYYKCI